MGEESSAGFIAITVILTSIVLGTIIGNFFVISAILVDKNLQTTANQLVLSLAISDLMVACLVMPLGAYNEIYQGWYLSKEVCEFWTSADVLCCTASILNLLAIALDRYWAVTNVDYIYRRTRQRVNMMILCAWAVGASVSLAPIFGWKDPDFANRVLLEHKCLVSQDVGYQVFATVSSFYAPLVLLLALYWRIFQVARKRIRTKPGRQQAIQQRRPPAAPARAPEPDEQVDLARAINYLPKAAPDKDESARLTESDRPRASAADPPGPEAAGEGAARRGSAPANEQRGGAVQIAARSQGRHLEGSREAVMSEATRSQVTAREPPASPAAICRLGEVKRVSRRHRRPDSSMIESSSTVGCNFKAGNADSARGDLLQLLQLARGTKGRVSPSNCGSSSSSWCCCCCCSQCQVQLHTRDPEAGGCGQCELRGPPAPQINHPDRAPPRDAYPRCERAQMKLQRSGRPDKNIDKALEVPLRGASENSLTSSSLAERRLSLTGCVHLSVRRLQGLANQPHQRDSSSRSFCSTLASSELSNANDDEARCRRRSSDWTPVNWGSNSDSACSSSTPDELDASLSASFPPPIELLERRCCQAQRCPELDARRSPQPAEDSGCTPLSGDDARRAVDKPEPNQSGAEVLGSPAKLSASSNKSSGERPPALQKRRSLDIRRRFRVMGQLVSFVQTSNPHSASLQHSSTSQSEETPAARAGQDVAPPPARLVPPAARPKPPAASSSREPERRPAAKTPAPAEAPKNSARRRRNMDIRREKKAAKTLAIITGVFVCCWLPFFLNAIVMPICGASCTPSDLVLSILLWLGYLNSLLNPIIYTIFSPDFRRAFRRLLCLPRLAQLGSLLKPADGAPATDSKI